MAGEVLCDRQIKGLIKDGIITNAEDSETKKLLSVSSLDLRLGPNTWRLIGSPLLLPGQTIDDLLKTGVVDSSHSERGEFFLEREQPYLFELVEGLELPHGLSARIHNKSGRGRIGMSIKGLSDGVPRNNDIPRGYKGRLYLEVTSTTFPVLVQCGETALPQIRFYDGDPVPVKGYELERLIEKGILLDGEGNPIRFSEEEMERMRRTGRVPFRADLSRDLLIYRAKRDRKTLDLGKKNHYDPRDFFEEVRAKREEKNVNEQPGDFGLLLSRERIRVPPEYCVEIPEYSPELGDVKIHYAGLINAGHGFRSELPDGGKGDHIVFEVRARDVPRFWQNGQLLAEFEVYKMSQVPDGKYTSVQSTNFDSLATILPAIFKKD